MLRKLMIRVIGAICMGTFVPMSLSALDARSGGTVVFLNNSSYYGEYPYYGGHRLWILGQARHWDPRNNVATRNFLHLRGALERIDFGIRPVGSSRGDTRVILGAVCTLRGCRSPLYSYFVRAGMGPIYTMINHSR